MKKAMMTGMLWVVAAFAAAQDPKPIWHLGKNPIDPAAVKGNVALADGVVTLDGSNSFSLPADLVGSRNDYAIEFEVRRATDADTARDSMFIVSNTDSAKGAGLGFKYYPPPYNAAELYVNGHLTLAYSPCFSKAFDKITIVAKDKRLSVFRNGLIIVMTDEVKPSSVPLTWGEVLKGPIKPYQLRNIKIYDQAFFPAGSEQKASAMMRTYSGDQYFMQRVEIKDPALPRILVVGDSIAGGYQEFIREHFKDRAYVDFWRGGGWFAWTVKGDDFPVLRGWSGVLSNGPYDVVSWNSMTLHMWTSDAKTRCLEETYAGHMTRVVEHLRKTAPHTRFIWVRCTPHTTPVQGQPSVINMAKTERLIRFNAMTDEIMRKYGIPEVDLYGLCERNLDKASKDGVHWNEAAARLMAGEIIGEIEKALPRVGAAQKQSH